MKTYKKEGKDVGLEVLTTGLSKNCNEIMENLCKKLVDLEDELSLEGDDYFVIETVIEKKVEEFDIKECLLVLAGIFDLKDSNFVLDILERECLIKVLNFLGTHPLRLHRIMMYTDWIFKKECEQVLETENVEKLRSLAITLGMHFDNLISLLRSITDEKDEKVFRDIFSDIFSDLAKEINKIIPNSKQEPVQKPVHEPEPLAYFEPRVVAGIKSISSKESILKRRGTKEVSVSYFIESAHLVCLESRGVSKWSEPQKKVTSYSLELRAGYKPFTRKEEREKELYYKYCNIDYNIAKAA